MAVRRKIEVEENESGFPVLDEVRRRSEKFFRMYLDGRRREAASMKSSLIRFIRRSIARGDAPKDLLWLQLSDVYVQIQSQEKCLLQALKISPKNPEVHSGLSLVYARRGNKPLCLKHCEEALRNCSGYDIEDVIVTTVKEALIEIEMEDSFDLMISRDSKRGRS